MTWSPPTDYVIQKKWLKGIKVVSPTERRLMELREVSSRT